VQKVLDGKRMSIALKDYMLKELYGHLFNNYNSVDFKYKDGLGMFQKKMPSNWTCNLERPSSIPSSFKCLIVYIEDRVL